MLSHPFGGRHKPSNGQRRPIARCRPSRLGDYVRKVLAYDFGLPRLRFAGTGVSRYLSQDLQNTSRSPGDEWKHCPDHAADNWIGGPQWQS
jgi:hypothetical protein